MRRPDVSSQTLDDELILYDPDLGRAHVLNRTAAQVWSLCDGTRSVEAIARQLATAHGIELEQALVDVRDLVDDFGRADLLAAP